MNAYTCDNCGSVTDEVPCPFCQSTRVRLVDATESPFAEVPALPEPPPVEPAPQAPAPPQPQQHSQPPRTQHTQKRVVGLEEFDALLRSGFQAVVICGPARSGKSEIATGFTRANTVFRGRSQVSTSRTSSGTLYVAGGTNPGEVWFEIANTPRKLVFLDPSGEFFRQLSPTERQRLRLPDVTEEYFDFVRSAVSKLAGVVVVVDLTRTVDDFSDAPWRSQEIDLDFNLAAIRWLRHAKEARIEGLSVERNIAAQVLKKPKLDVPVLVLFSKADLLPDDYSNQVPIDFARERLPHLHASLLTHARHFRFEFAHTMLGEGDRARRETRPCGVLLSMEWLLSDPFRWMPRLPTRWLGGGKT